MLLGDDIDDTSDGIASVERTRGSLHDFYLLDVMRIDKSQIVLASIIAIESMTINQNEHIRIAQTIHLQMGAHIVLAEIERGSES